CMAKLSILLGGVLVLVGVLGWVATGFESWTALLPTILGLPIVGCGVMTNKQPEKSMVYMHIAVVLAAVLLIGSGSRIPKLEEFGSVKSVTIWVSTLVSFILVGAFVNSFLQARLAKKG